MTTVNLRELANAASRVVADVAEGGRPVFVTRHGRPVAALVPVDDEALLDFVLDNAPEYVADIRRGDELVEADAGAITHAQLFVAALGGDEALEALAEEAEADEQGALATTSQKREPHGG